MSMKKQGAMTAGAHGRSSGTNPFDLYQTFIFFVILAIPIPARRGYLKVTLHLLSKPSNWLVFMGLLPSARPENSGKANISYLLVFLGSESLLPFPKLLFSSWEIKTESTIFHPSAWPQGLLTEFGKKDRGDWNKLSLSAFLILLAQGKLFLWTIIVLLSKFKKGRIPWLTKKKKDIQLPTNIFFSF